MTSAIMRGLIADLGDPSLTEILVNGTRSLVRCRADGARFVSASPFSSDERFEDELQEWAFSQGLRLDPLLPAAGGEWRHERTTGRWHAVLPPLATDGPILSLRRHCFDTLALSDIRGDARAKALVCELWEGCSPLFIIGPTGSGKTTLLMALLKEFSKEERVVFLERTAELPLLSPLWIRLVEQGSDISGRGAFGLGAALEETLRLKPDRIVLSEMRGAEARVGWQSLLVGEGAFVTTLHAASPRLLGMRLSFLLGDDTPWRELFEELRPGIVQMTRADPARIAVVHPWEEWSSLLLFAAK